MIGAQEWQIKSGYVSSLGAIRTCFAAFFLTALVSCKPSAPHGIPGQITLSYSGATDSWIGFVLENRSAQAITLRATKKFWTGVIPWDTAMECRPANSSIVDENPFALMDGGQFQSISISPGEQMRLSIEKDAFSRRNKDSHCRLRLRLQNAAVIESNDFGP